MVGCRRLAVGLLAGLTLVGGLGVMSASPVLAYACGVGQTCSEQDTPGTGNSVTATWVPNDNSPPGGLGHYCLHSYYSSSGTVVLQGQAVNSANLAPQDVIFRVWFSSDDPNMGDKIKLQINGQDHLNADTANVYIQSPPSGGSLTTPGYFQGCFQNYEDLTISVNVTTAINQAD